MSISIPVRPWPQRCNRSTTLNGVWPDYFEIRDWPVERGRHLLDEDERRAARVCLLGASVTRDVFAGVEAVGSKIRVHDMACTVVGVLEAKGSSTFGRDQDDVVFMPFSTFSRLVAGTDRVGMIMISATDEAATDLAMDQINDLMRQRRRILTGEDDDFSVRDMREVQNILGSITGVLTALLAGVAAVSLVVGGIGIMNIMLVSVTERTREIGIRLAVGARSADILQQFLLESIVLSTLGGTLGIILGIAGGWAVARGLDLPFVLPWTATAIAFGFAIIVGVVFGVFPARKAARLRPIEALRFE